MKKSTLLTVFILLAGAIFAQIKEPVKWSFSAKKIEGNNYEIHITASIERGWHIYSQSTPDGGPVPTSFSFTSNPLISLEGKVSETGKLEQKHEPLFGVDVKQYSNKVVFIQKLKLKASAKTALKGSVEFMSCNNQECLPPKKESFSINLQ